MLRSLTGVARANIILIAAFTIVIAIVSSFALFIARVENTARLVSATRLEVENRVNRFRAAGLSLKDTAQRVAAEMDSGGSVQIAFFDDKGTFVAGDSSLAADAPRVAAMLRGGPPPMPPPIPPGALHMPLAHGLGPTHIQTITRTLDVRMAEDMGPAVGRGFSHTFTSAVRFLGGGFALVQGEVGFISSGIWRFTAFVSLLGVLACVLSWYLTRRGAARAFAPVESVTLALQRLAGGDFSRFMPTSEEQHAAGALLTAYNAAASTAAAAVDERQRLEANMRQFVADAGHELRTPLTVIMGYIDVLHRGAIAEQMLARRILDTMHDEGERMRSLINKLLSLARMENAEVRNEARIDVAAVARKVVESARPIANSSTLALEADQAVFVHADEAELREALSNIIDNALKYAAGSVIQTTVSRRNGDAVVEVRDHGNGMTADERAHAFERFFRGHNRDIPGSGLGLAIAKRSVERAHGRISLESVPGNGTVVTIVLPVSDGVSG